MHEIIRIHVKTALIGLLLFIFSFLTVYSAQAYTLDQLMHAAIENRDVIKKYKAAVEKSVQVTREAKSGYYPSLDANYGFFRRNKGNTTSPPIYFKETDSASIGISWNLFAGLREYYRIKSSEELEQVEELNLLYMQQDIMRLVAQYFLIAYQSRETLKVAEESVKLFEDRYRETKLKYEVGVLKKQDVLSIKVDLDDAIQNARVAKAMTIQSINELSRHTGVHIDPAISLDYSIFDKLPIVSDEDIYKGLMFTNRSDIKALEHRITAAGFNIQSEKSSFYPKFDLSAKLLSSHYDGYFWDSRSSKYADSQGVIEGVVSVNLFNGFAKYARINQAKISEHQIQCDLSELKEDLILYLKNSFLNLQVAFDNLEVAQSSVIEAEENLRVIDLSYGQGLSKTIDLTDGIYNLSRARLNVVTARASVFSNYFDIERLIEKLGQ